MTPPSKTPPPGHDPVFHDLFVMNPLPMWLFDSETLRFLEVNQAAVKRYGYTRDEFLLMTLEDIRPKEDVERLHEALRNRPQDAAAGYRRSPGWRHLLKDGTVIWVDIYSYDFKYGDRVVRLIMVHDVTDLKHAAERLNRQGAYFRQLFENSPEAIVMLDHEDRIADANHAFENLFQYRLEELRGRAVNDVIVPEEKAQEATTLTLTALGSAAVRRDTVRRRKDGSLVEVSALGYPITIEGQKVGVFAIYRDITDSKRIAGELAYHSTHDMLTGLMNRHEFERRARDLLQRAGRSSKDHALLYMDIDQFKVINDTLGHEAGDRLLLDLTEVIRHALRDTDELARLGGDEFGALLSACPLGEANTIAQRVLNAVHSFRFHWDDKSLAVGISIGVVGIGREMENLTALLSAADTACYTAKERGRGRVQVYRPEDQDMQRMRGELSWATRINDALEHDRFALYYQKIVPVAVTGVGSKSAMNGARYEVLLRMIGAEGQSILPSLFIPAAERYGLMPAVDRRVVTRVIRQMASVKNGEDQVSVNLSGTSLSEEGLSDFIREQLNRYKLRPQRVCFEITESSAIANLSRALSFIRDLRELGCSIALDDFGVGMSSFNYLKSLSVDYLKIDGAFIRDLAHNPLDCAMTEAINKVGQVKGIKTIAECVESGEALAKLSELGVNFAQGFYIHHPEPWGPAGIATH
jgi:diguanylate cyclase (GGDEF)-like protein/PAS domain S-box-containing protein